MKKINVEQIKKFAGKTCKYVAYGVLLTFIGKRYEDMMSYVYENSTSDDDEIYEISYGGAVKAIVNSDMSSYYKNQAMSVLKRGAESDIYEAVIHIANDLTTSSYYKYEMIQRLFK